MHQVDHITLTFEDKGSLQDDLVLRIGERAWRADSYFLWCENPREDAAPEIIHRVLGKLLEQWTGAISNLKDGESRFLPFDLSDQCTQWLHCTLESERVHVRMGWSKVEGWSFSPSNVGDLMKNVPDFQPSGFEATIARADMLESLALPRAT